MYKTIFVMAYYGLFRIGEFTSGNSSHTIRARNVHVASNKDKILVILYSSKTHGLESVPQKVKITSAASYARNKLNQKKFFCPFCLIKEYLALRGGYTDESEPFFIFKDGTYVKDYHIRLFP